MARDHLLAFDLALDDRHSAFELLEIVPRHVNRH